MIHLYCSICSGQAHIIVARIEPELPFEAWSYVLLCGPECAREHLDQEIGLAEAGAVDASVGSQAAPRNDLRPSDVVQGAEAPENGPGGGVCPSEPGPESPTRPRGDSKRPWVKVSPGEGERAIICGPGGCLWE